MEFKVGDKVKGISNDYYITNRDMYLGEIKSVGDNCIEILVLEHKNSKYEGETYTVIKQTDKFEIVENLTISQLQSEIDKLSNKVSKEYSDVISNKDKINYLKEQLKELIKEPKKEKNKSILDDEEKEYLSAVIRPFKNKVAYIEKCGDLRDEYINIKIINDAKMSFPYFDIGTMYEGMEKYKKYTLKELDLDKK